jgi:hypothetical protein
MLSTHTHAVLKPRVAALSQFAAFGLLSAACRPHVRADWLMSSVEMPIYLALFQACTADGKFATNPGDRAVPALGGLTLPGGYVF